MTTPHDEAPLTHDNELLEVFEGAFRPRAHLVGIEAEKFGLFDSRTPLHYHDTPVRPGVETLFRVLVDRFGWKPDVEVPGGPTLALLRDGASITLEPGAQFELSGTPHGDVHALWAEVDAHRRELAALTELPGLRWVALGFHPFARQNDLDWVPKSRYPVMQRYFPSKGTRGIDMMRRTATVQANFDFTSERDAMRKLRVALAAGPIVTALFAASPLVEGIRTAFKSYRAHVWLDVDNDRTGLLPFAWRPDATLGDYVRWALDVPMFIVKRGSAVIDATRYTFRRFLREGIDGHRATRSDWESHLKTLFPDARLQKTLEVRGADSVPARLSMALPALWIGLLYDEEGLCFVEDRLCTLGHDTWAAVRAVIPTQGLAAKIGHTTVGALARELVAVASRALIRRGVTDAQGRNEAQFLAPLEACVVDGRSLGDLVLDDWNDADPDALMARAAY